ncbi:MAG: hypothetical protein GC137_00230 [Alphaproteobacteria bacterium]|nr:hypothetical protein [Alphaproteobacteria bacterium]
MAQDPLMRVNAIPYDGISHGVINLQQVFNLEGGCSIPFGIAHLENYQELLEKCVKKVADLDNRLRSGFRRLFSSNPEVASSLLRRAFNVLPNENPFLEKLIETLARQPELCELKTILYRVDGLNGGDQIVINELNANPIGAFWLHRLHQDLKTQSAAFNIAAIPDIFVEKIKKYTGSDKAFFLPVRSLGGPSSYTEKMILKELIDKLGVKFFMGEPESLEYEEDGVYISWQNERYRIGYIGGLSSPEVFMNVPELIEQVEKGNVYCPALIDNIIGLSNKGMFCVLTDMRHGKLNPGLFDLSGKDLETWPIPNTYWLYDRASNVDNTGLFGQHNMVAKPIEGVGGHGILFNQDIERVTSLAPSIKNKYMIQDYYPSFEVDGERRMYASLDPYFTNDADATIVGVLVRSALEGFLPNLTINSKSSLSQETRTNLFSIGVS